MSTWIEVRKHGSVGEFPRRFCVAAALGLLGAVSMTPAANAQNGAAMPVVLTAVDAGSESSSSAAELPDAPDALAPRAGGRALDANIPDMAGQRQKYILPGQQAPKNAAGDKVVMGIKDALSPLSLIGWAASAGYEQLTDSSPNYGQTGTGYAQRLGAAALRATTEDIFGDSVLAPLLHEDMRYYKLGKGHNFVKRLVYSGTRGLITKTDGGHTTVNLANIGGNLAGSALTNVYYPQINRGLEQTMETFGGSVGGSALGFVVSEFLSDTLTALHVEKAH